MFAFTLRALRCVNTFQSGRVKDVEIFRWRTSLLLEIALVQVRFDRVATVIVNANHGII